jgi:hypothetical protein
MVDKKVQVIGQDISKTYFDSYIKLGNLGGKIKPPKYFKYKRTVTQRQ